MRPLFVPLNVLAVVAAGQLAAILFRGRDLGQRVLAIIAGYLLIIQVLMLALGTFGQLSAAKACIGLLTLVAVLAALQRTLGRVSDCGPMASEGLLEPAGGEREALETLVLACFLAFVGLWIQQTLIAGTHFLWDDLTYHAPPVAQWLKDERISTAITGKYAFYPLNGELISLWFCLPFHDDAFAGCTGALAALLAALGGALLVRRQGGSRSAGLLAALLILATPQVLASAKSFSSTDLLGPACLLAALALAACERSGDAEKQNARSLLANAAYISALAGFAAGCKVTFLPVAAVLVVGHLLLSSRNHPPAVRLVQALCCSLALGLTGSYWYLRNWILEGNPLYPAQFGPFSGVVPAEHLRASQLSTWLLHHSLSGAEWRELLKQHLNFPIGLFLVSTAGYMVAIFHPPRNADESRAPREVALLLLSCGLAALVFFPFMPYSGTYEDTTVLRIDRRYLIAPFLIGYLLLLPWLEQHARRGPIWTGFFLAVAISGGFAMVRQAREFSADGTAISLAALVVLTIPYLRSHLLPRLRTLGPVSLLSCAVLAFALLATLHAARLRSATTNLYLYLQSGPDKPLARGYEAIEALPAGSRITQYGQALLYPTYGRRYQFVPVPSWPIGKSVEERVVRLDGHLGDPVSKPPTADLVDRLAAKQVGYVVISKHDTGDWPPERAQLAASKAARLRYGDGYTELWELRPVEDPSS